MFMMEPLFGSHLTKGSTKIGMHQIFFPTEAFRGNHLRSIYFPEYWLNNCFYISHTWRGYFVWTFICQLKNEKNDWISNVTKVNSWNRKKLQNYFRLSTAWRSFEIVVCKTFLRMNSNAQYHLHRNMILLAIWYHLYSLKKVKNTYKAVLLLVKLQA